MLRLLNSKILDNQHLQIMTRLAEAELHSSARYEVALNQVSAMLDQKLSQHTDASSELASQSLAAAQAATDASSELASQSLARYENILNHLMRHAENSSESTKTTKNHLNTELEIWNKLDGWCTPHKREKLIEYGSHAHCAVEIGIFGGKSIIPIALGQQKAGRNGVVYGIEPWNSEDAVETPTNEQNDDWWRSIDWVKIKAPFLQALIDLNLTSYVKIIELMSDDALSMFSGARFHKKIDLVHIDGNHSEAQALRDVDFWTHITAPGATIILDDINWDSVRPAYKKLCSSGKVLYETDSVETGSFVIVKLNTVR
jgi:Methyltransferase domain